MTATALTLNTVPTFCCYHYLQQSLLLLPLLLLLQVCDASRAGRCPRFQATSSGGKLLPTYLCAFKAQCSGCTATVKFKSPFENGDCGNAPVNAVSLSVGAKFTQCTKAMNVNGGEEVTLSNVAHGSMMYAYVYDATHSANTVSRAVAFKELGRPACRAAGSDDGYCGRYGGFAVNCGTNCRRNY
jgi:hypothetical protein